MATIMEGFDQVVVGGAACSSEVMIFYYFGFGFGGSNEVQLISKQKHLFIYVEFVACTIVLCLFIFLICRIDGVLIVIMIPDGTTTKGASKESKQ
jgi:hypothetical protein